MLRKNNYDIIYGILITLPSSFLTNFEYFQAFFIDFEVLLKAFVDEKSFLCS